MGLTDNADPAYLERLRSLGYVEVFTKPVNVDEVLGGLNRILERRRLQRQTGLIGESEGMREVMVQVEQMAEDSYRLCQTGIVALLQALQASRDTRLRSLQSASDFQDALGELERVIGAPLP